MKLFLKQLFIFSLPLLLCWSAIELLYRKVPNNYNIKSVNVVNSYKHAEVLILGNSHSFYGINPVYFQKETFNLSNVSQTLFIDELLLNKHMDHLSNLKCVVLNVDYFSLSEPEDLPELKWRNYFYESQMEIETGLIRAYDVKKYSLALAPPFKISLNSVKAYFKNGTLAECDSSGWAAKKGVGPDNRPRMGFVIAKKHEFGCVGIPKNKARLKRIIDKCKSKGVKVILVTMPVTSHYADEVNKNNLEGVISACKNFDSDYRNVQYINLFQDNRFNNNDFYDVDHLNTVGAKKCSEIVDSLINHSTF